MNNKKVILEINNVSKIISNQTILHDINLKIYQGEFFALLGPSGCGKTTLLRMIAGFEEYEQGEIKIDGIDIKNIPPYKRPVNMVFQSYALFPHLDVYHNIAFGLYQEQLPEEIIKTRVEEVLSMLKIDNLRGRNITELSGGQQQRVALARSIVKRPKILLLDEPMGALDIKTREHTQIELINIQHLLGITFVMVTHNQQEAIAMANRIAVMNGGQILQYGSPRQIYDYPESRFVADFIGRVNFLNAKIIDYEPHNNIITLQLEHFTQNVRLKNPEYNTLDAEIQLALRPEELLLTLTEPDNGDNYITGKISEISFAGSEYIYYITLAGEQLITVTSSTAAGVENAEFIIGIQVYVSWHIEDGVILTD